MKSNLSNRILHPEKKRTEEKYLKLFNNHTYKQILVKQDVYLFGKLHLLHPLPEEKVFWSWKV